MEDHRSDARAVPALPAAQAAARRLPDLWHLQRPPRHQRLTGRVRVTRDHVRVAVDLLGGDHGPDVVVDGALLAAEASPSVVSVLVGPPDIAERALATRAAGDRIE